MKHLNLALAVSLLGCGSLRDYPLDVPADRPVDATDGAVSDTPTDQPTPTDLPTDNGPADVPTVDVPAADVPRADVLADVPLTDVPLIDVPSVDVPPMDVPVDAGSADVLNDVSVDVPRVDASVDAGFAADVMVIDTSLTDLGTDAADVRSDTPDSSGCTAQQVLCGSVCTDLSINLMNCGACGNACAVRANSRPVCAAGVCTNICDAGFANCDGLFTNGCEVPLNVTPFELWSLRQSVCRPKRRHCGMLRRGLWIELPNWRVTLPWRVREPRNQFEPLRLMRQPVSRRPILREGSMHDGDLDRSAELHSDRAWLWPRRDRWRNLYGR